MDSFYLLCVFLVIITDANSCFTPDNKPGSCIIIKNCPSLLQILQLKPLPPNELNYLQQSQCGFEGKTPKVCCPEIDRTIDEAQTIPNLNNYTVVQSVETRTGEKNDAQDECKTSRDEVGNCVLIKNCEPMLEILQMKPIPPSEILYLRQSQCGFDESSAVKICCPKNRIENRNVLPVTENLLPDKKTCGVSSVNKIFGGQATELNEFPWMALIQYQKADFTKEFHCGGALISKKYVLTAAHCIIKKPKHWSVISVRLGEYDTSNDKDCEFYESKEECADDPIDVPIEKQIAHELYSPNTVGQYNDIALLRLVREVPITDFIIPICLPSPQIQLNDLYVAGWGRTEYKSESNVKLKVKIPLVEKDDCIKQYKRATLSLRSTQMCAGGQKRKDSCQGDSGGPLMTQSLDRSGPEPTANWYVIGIVSFGPTRCGSEGWPGIYTNVMEYVPWIVSKLRE